MLTLLFLTTAIRAHRESAAFDQNHLALPISCRRRLRLQHRWFSFFPGINQCGKDDQAEQRDSRCYRYRKSLLENISNEALLPDQDAPGQWFFGKRTNRRFACKLRHILL